MSRANDLSDLPTLRPPSSILGQAFVYILACQDGSLYTGSAHDLSKRLTEHGKRRGAKFIRDHPGARLIYIEGPSSEDVAVRRERQIKRWGRAKKSALIRNQTARLRELSRSRETKKAANGNISDPDEAQL
jgi:putative endonuclease